MADAADLVTLGEQAFNRGAFSQAAANWEQAVPLFRAQSDAGGEIRTTVSLAAAYQAMGQHRRAVGMLEAALIRAEQIGEIAWNPTGQS